MDEIAHSEKINSSYVSRVLRLTLLAPDIVEDILSGRTGPEFAAKTLLQPSPLEWERQRPFILNSGDVHA